MRLFVALEISAAVRENLAALIRELRPLAPQARWARAENLHVTLKFIGEVAPAKLDALQRALSSVRGEGPIAMDFRGLGFFPDERRPRVFWVGIVAGPALARLAREIEGRLEPLGIPRDPRAFSPHLTLARFQPPGRSERLRSAIQENATREFGSLHTNQLHLIESKLKSSGAEYFTLESFRFVVAEA